jgi:membrane protein implicated in regulation of membrane protease activity
MWRVMIRTIMAFAFTIFGRKVIALAGTVILLFVAAVLVDLKMYVSAGFACVLALAALIAFFIQYRRQIKANRIRARRQEEAAQKRAAATEARNEKMDRAKTKVTDTVKGMTAGATDAAKSGFAGARDRVQGWRK